ncbi:MAG: DUF1311 domain-containing protein [Gammaproteobacteria bacterium]|nr:DUF1311 domain-containing protein [Gammaproteobacteria bacterium]MBU0828751.1 DUF1311 domain-containing protein [Gammaproteobacteria bacterium]MBU0889861.1 DUF1311 domain-containing protein [Gammaproteobacteria bacterium]MBU1815913.1 DUF1311 domain-containing protein [Gammaproteobacteria bacterium]
MGLSAVRALLSTLVLLGMCSGASAQAPEPSAPTPAFDCNAAEKTVEHWICASPELMQADVRLTKAYQTALAKPDGDAELAALRTGQLRWLRLRNRCEDVACVAAAYRQRTADLQAVNRSVRVLNAEGFAPVFSRTLPHINDTRGVGGIALRRAQPAAFQVELYIDPADARPWRDGGPGVRMVCWPPDRREGYAARFEYAVRSWGDAFRPVERSGQRGYVLLRFVLGKDLPLNEDIVCNLALTEWLLDQPSQLHIVETRP